MDVFVNDEQARKHVTKQVTNLKNACQELKTVDDIRYQNMR
jgi:hypothetical protein